MALLLFISIFMMASLSAAPDAAVFGAAQWLRDPVFDGAQVMNYAHRDKEKPPEPTGPANIHTLFRKEITVRENIKSAWLAITGDDYYKFSINGCPVVQGPESGYPSAHPYYYLDIAKLLEPGTLCLASHSYYQGLRNRVWNSGDNRSGFMLRLDIVYEDGATEQVVTDASWKCFPLQAFPTGELFGYKTQFAENMDMRLIPTDWNQPGFDDSAWIAPLIGFQDHTFTEQITPPLQIVKSMPQEAKALGKGRYFYDFGREIVGGTRIRIKGAAGQQITVRHGEELSAPDTVRWEMRANCKYEEKPVLSGKEDLIEFYDYKAFRYVEVLDAPAAPELWVDVRHYPFDPTRVAFTCADKRLENIWNICRNGVQMGSQGGFLDCPSREKGQYLGDAVIAARSHLWLTADPALTKKCLYDFAMSRWIHPGLMAVAPGSFMQEIAEYSLQYPLLLQEYYRHTGDIETVADIIHTTFDGLFGYFRQYENKDSLLEKMTEKWVLVDWPEGLRDGYDYEYAKERANTVLNAFYYGALRTAAELERAVGGDGAAYDAHAQRVAQGFAKCLANPETGLYVDAPGSKHSSLHANAIPLFFGLDAGADREKMLAFIAGKRLSCGVYIASYVIEACFKSGANKLAYDLLTSEDEHSWNEMLRHGATTCMEAWGPDQKKNCSWCHPWSSSPIYLIAEYVFGVSPAQPGWKAVRVSPAMIPELPEMTLTIPLPSGAVTARHQPGIGYTITAPEGMPVETHAAEGVNIIVKYEPSHTPDPAP